MTSFRSRLEKLEALTTPTTCACIQPRKILLLAKIDGELFHSEAGEKISANEEEMSTICPIHRTTLVNAVVLVPLEPESLSEAQES